MTQRRQNLANVNHQFFTLAAGEESHDPVDGIGRSECGDESPEHTLKREPPIRQRLLERVEVALEHSLPEVADVGHVDQDEHRGTLDRRTSEGAQKMGLADATAPHEHPAQGRFADRHVGHLLDFTFELSTDRGM